ncbi:hypothetical protein F5884DRAFT_745315 [Xylogone sp. PMI_703]|nr:hypothetical protein F5884DRAFT_745315 [Xylogone sp. PMI_703]
MANDHYTARGRLDDKNASCVALSVDIEYTGPDAQINIEPAIDNKSADEGNVPNPTATDENSNEPVTEIMPTPEDANESNYETDIIATIEPVYDQVCRTTSYLTATQEHTLSRNHIAVPIAIKLPRKGKLHNTY